LNGTRLVVDESYTLSQEHEEGRCKGQDTKEEKETMRQSATRMTFVVEIVLTLLVFLLILDFVFSFRPLVENGFIGRCHVDEEDERRSGEGRKKKECERRKKRKRSYYVSIEQ
jgi:hypothetical protein